MIKKNYKYIVLSIIVIVILVSSFAWKVKVDKSNSLKAQVPEALKGKTVVTLWMRESDDTPTRKYQIEKYNRENKDNIAIQYFTYNEDYFNLLRMNLAADNNLDIFQYGYYELVKNDQLLPLKDLGINDQLLNKSNLLSFNGKAIGSKISGNDVKLIWNKDIFIKCGLDPNKPPKTWQEVIDYSKKIKSVCPDVIPFEFPAYTWGELKDSVGEIASNQGPIYTTFWNYKDGKYEFDYAKDILSSIKEMYDEKLIPSNFDNKDKQDLRRDFYSKQAAMTISTFEDKNYYNTIVPLDFNLGIADIPKLHQQDTENYYYTENYTCLVVNKNVSKTDEKHKEAVKKVYEWLLSSEVNNELAVTGKVLPTVNNTNAACPLKYPEYNDVSKFSHETYDPTIFINYNPDDTKNSFIDAIKGKKSISDSIKELNSKYAAVYNFMKDKDSFDFESYIKK